LYSALNFQRSVRGRRGVELCGLQEAYRVCTYSMLFLHEMCPQKQGKASVALILGDRARVEVLKYIQVVAA